MLFVQLLVSVGLEDYHLLAVWDWKKGRVLATVRGHTDRVSSYVILMMLSYKVLLQGCLTKTNFVCHRKISISFPVSGNSNFGCLDDFAGLV